jgi:hypothetical protein
MSAYEEGQWMGKVFQLKTLYKVKDVNPPSPSLNTQLSRAVTSFRDANVNLDVSTMIEVTSSINKKKNLDVLLKTIAYYLLKNSGASKTIIVLKSAA